MIAVALSGPDGVAKAAELRGQYVAIIMDVQVPGSFDGIEATRLICDADDEAFVIMYSNSSRICEGLEVGASHFARGTDGEKMTAIMRRIQVGTHTDLEIPLNYDRS